MISESKLQEESVNRRSHLEVDCLPSSEIQIISNNQESKLSRLRNHGNERLSPQNICHQQEEGNLSQDAQSYRLQTSGHNSQDQHSLSVQPQKGNFEEVVNSEVTIDNDEKDVSLFNEVDQRTLRLLKINNTISSKIMHVVLTWGTKDKQSSSGFDEYLLKEKNLQNNHFKMIFSKDQREKMSHDPSGSTFDITLLFSCIKHACKDVAPPKSDLWFTRGDTLEQTLSYLKVFRNNMAHNMSKLTLSEFMELAESLRDKLETCIRLAGERYSIDKLEVEKIVNKMNNDINRCRDIPVTTFDITSYDNQPLFQEQLNLLLTHGKEEIVYAYKQFCNFNPVSFITGKEFSLNVGTVFTRIEVINDRKTPSNEKDCQKIEYENLLTFECKTVDGLNRIKVIEGPAGSGKSTLTRKMIGDWVSGENIMEDLLSFDLLLYMECRDTTNTSFLNLLTSFMPKTARRFRNNDIEKCALALKLLIIVDGLDEMNRTSRQLFREILDLKQRNDISLFCTTRPEKIEDLYRISRGEETTHLKITGIPPYRREEFASKYHDELRKHGKSEQETRGLIAYLKTNHQHLQDHLRLPLNLVLLIILWSIAPEKVNCVTTATELYYEIHKLTVDKLLLRLQSKEDIQHLSTKDLRCKVESFVIKLYKEALNGLKNDEIMLSDDSVSLLKNTCTEVGLPDEESLGAFLVHKVMWTSTGMHYKINYPHKGIQEFLSALIIVLKLKGKGIPLDIRSLIRSDLQQVSSECGCQSTSVTNESFRYCNCLNRIGNAFRNTYQVVYKRFREAFGGSNREPIFHTGRTPRISRIWREVSDSFRDLVYGSSFSSDITHILQQMYPEGQSIEYYKFKDTFIHLTGLLHLTSRNNISRPLVEELVRILQKTGIKKREEWLDLISNVKCDDIVADVIAERIPSITTEDITITDSRVYSYVSLFQKRCPESLNIDIRARPGDIPRLEELLHLLSHHVCEVTSLEFHDEFQYPSHITSSIDWAVQQIFQDCQVQCYRGAISQRFPTNIPSTVRKFRTGIANSEQFIALCELLASTSTVLSSVRRIVVHLSKGIDWSQLRPLPSRMYVHLYLSDIDASSVEWACKAARAIQPDIRGFANIMFPRCTLSASNFEELVRGLAHEGVNVTSTVCTSAKIPFTCEQQLKNHTQLALKADFKLIPEQDIWSKW